MDPGRGSKSRGESVVEFVGHTAVDVAQMGGEGKRLSPARWFVRWTQVEKIF